MDDEKVQQPLPEEEADGVWFVDDTKNLIASFAGVRGAITLAGVLDPAALAGCTLPGAL
ncbi:hypothetical protein ACLB1N_21815 [Escherichia coli]